MENSRQLTFSECVNSIGSLRVPSFSVFINPSLEMSSENGYNTYEKIGPRPPSDGRNGQTVKIERKGSHNVVTICENEPIFLTDAEVPVFLEERRRKNKARKRRERVAVHKPDSTHVQNSSPRHTMTTGQKYTHVTGVLDYEDLGGNEEISTHRASKPSKSSRKSQSAGSSSNHRKVKARKEGSQNSFLSSPNTTTTTNIRVSPRTTTSLDFATDLQNIFDYCDSDEVSEGEKDSICRSLSRVQTPSQWNILSEVSRRAMIELQRKCEDLEGKYTGEVSRRSQNERLATESKNMVDMSKHRAEIVKGVCEKEVHKKNIQDDISEEIITTKEPEPEDDQRHSQTYTVAAAEYVQNSKSGTILTAIEKKDKLTSKYATEVLDGIMGVLVEKVSLNRVSKEVAVSFVESQLSNYMTTVIASQQAECKIMGTLKKETVDDLVSKVLGRAVSRLSGTGVVTALIPESPSKPSDDVEADPTAIEIHHQYKNTLQALQQEVKDSQRIIQELQLKHKVLQREFSISSLSRRLNVDISKEGSIYHASASASTNSGCSSELGAYSSPKTTSEMEGKREVVETIVEEVEEQQHHVQNKEDEDPDKDPGEDADKDPGEDADKDPGEDPDKDPGEDADKDPGENPDKDSGEDPDKDPDEDFLQGLMESFTCAKMDLLQEVSGKHYRHYHNNSFLAFIDDDDEGHLYISRSESSSSNNSYEEEFLDCADSVQKIHSFFFCDGDGDGDDDMSRADTVSPGNCYEDCADIGFEESVLYEDSFLNDEQNDLHVNSCLFEAEDELQQESLHNVSFADSIADLRLLKAESDNMVRRKWGNASYFLTDRG